MEHAPVETPYGRIPSGSAEVCGELLQSLSRYYCATADPRFLQWAFRIGDAWIFGVLPYNNGLPCHTWNFVEGKPENASLSLSDHGNEILFGLSELLMLAHVHAPDKTEAYLPWIKAMIDTLLESAVNEHGLWVRKIDTATGNVMSRQTPDTWGYVLNAVYILYMVTGDNTYLDAVTRAMNGLLSDARYANWGGADAFADAIESGVALYRFLPEPVTREWLDRVVPVFLAKQREDGIVEGWHGDGNYARTALMWALMHTAGTYITDWRDDVMFGAVVQDSGIHVHLSSKKPWSGKLHFDYPRHRMHFGLKLDYPRLNHFPEWYTVEPTRLYEVVLDGRPLPQPLLGDDLVRGLDIELSGKPLQVMIWPLPGPPYNTGPGGPVVWIDDGVPRIMFNEEQYKGSGYQWCGKEPITFTMPAARGQAHTLHLLWGAKGDTRSAIVHVNKHVQRAEQGGYDGFRWLTVPVPAETVVGDNLDIRIEKDPDGPHAAFIGEAKLTHP
jgi:hypothetical protein